MIFTLVMPPAVFLLFGGLSSAHHAASARRGNVSAYLMIGFAVYGSMIADTSAGASVAVERALGWSRRLRLTPLTPLAYIATKLLTAMVVGAASVAVVFAVGALGGATMPGWVWVVSGLGAWIGAIVFAAFGVFVGYLLPAEDVMQYLGPVLALLALMGGLFVPLSRLSDTLRTLASFTPRLRHRHARSCRAARRGCGRRRGRQRLDGGLRGRGGVAVPPRHRPV